MTQGYNNGVQIDIDASLTANSDQLVASQKAVKTYIGDVTANINTATESSDTACFPVFVTDSGTQAIPAKTNTSFTYNSSTNVLGTRLLASAGSATAGTAPIKITLGAFNTTPEVGAIEQRADDSTNSFGLHTTNNTIFGRENCVTYNEFYCSGGQSGLSGSAKPVWISTGAASPYNANNDIPIYQRSSNTLHEIEMDIIYSVSTACTVTFTFTSGVNPASSGWFTRVIHSPLAGATSGNSGTINQSVVTLDILSNSTSNTQTLTVSPSGSGSFCATIKMKFLSTGVGTGSLKTTMGTTAGTFTINALSSWKCRVVPNNTGNVIA